MGVCLVRKHREVNIVSKGASSDVTFRMLGLCRAAKLLWERKLASIPCEWSLLKTNDYVCLCDIESREIAEDLSERLKGISISFEHGIFVSLVTDRGRDRVKLAPFVSELYRCIGGTMDFSFVSGKLRKEAMFKGRRHREVNVVSGKAESTVTFHMEGLNRAEKLLWAKKLASVPCEWHYRRKLKAYGCLCCIESRDTADKIEALFGGAPVPFDHGIIVSMVTYRDNDGLRLGTFVSEFYRRIGGTLDFAIESGL